MGKRRLTFIAAVVLLAIPTGLAAGKAERPNFLFIIADDQSPFDLQLYNKRSKLETPHIDRLAREGMVLDGAHHMGSWSGAVCRPSRIMIMTGRSVWHLPNRRKRAAGNPNAAEPLRVPANLAENSLPAVFNRAGYDTMRTCKKGNSYEPANALFTVRHDATKRGSTAETGSAWHAARVLDYLEERGRSKDDDPFLIYFGFSHPHDVRDGTPELLAKYGASNHTDKEKLPTVSGNTPPLPINYLPKHPFHHGHPGLRDEVSVRGVWEKRDPSTMRNEIGRQFACSENIDIQIGRVLKKLEAMGELDNTYIIYTSDHGMAIGRHGLQGKQNLYEHTWRVPFVIRGPGIAAGSRAKGNIYLMDVLGTLCDLAGIEKPATCESTSFVPVLRGKQDSVREVLYGTYSGGTKPGMRCVKQGDWKLIKYDAIGGEVRETQLFNLKQNPWEFLTVPPIDPAGGPAGAKQQDPLSANLRDLAGDPEFRAKQREMEALLRKEMQRLHDPYQLWDQ